MAKSKSRQPAPTNEETDAAKRSPDEAQLRRLLTIELDELRAELREAIEAFRLRLEGQIAQVQETLAAPDPPEGEADRGARLATLTSAIAMLRELQVKPEKGRRRDLKQIEQALDAIRDQIIGW